MDLLLDVVLHDFVGAFTRRGMSHDSTGRSHHKVTDGAERERGNRRAFDFELPDRKSISKLPS